MRGRSLLRKNQVVCCGMQTLKKSWKRREDFYRDYGEKQIQFHITLKINIKRSSFKLTAHQQTVFDTQTFIDHFETNLRLVLNLFLRNR